MTILEAINDCKEKRPSQYGDSDFIRWLSELDLSMAVEVFSEYEGFEAEKDFEGYGPDVNQDTQLLIKAPYDSLYHYWLYAMVDFHNNDISRYNVAAAMYGEKLSSFKKHINRNDMPVQKNSLSHRWIGKGMEKNRNNPLG